MALRGVPDHGGQADLEPGAAGGWATASCRPGRVTTLRPRERSRILKKLPGAPGRDRAGEGRHCGPDRGLVRGRGTHRPEEQDHAAVGPAGLAALGTIRSAHGLDLHLRRHLPQRGQGSCPGQLGQSTHGPLIRQIGAKGSVAAELPDQRQLSDDCPSLAVENWTLGSRLSVSRSLNKDQWGGSSNKYVDAGAYLALHPENGRD